MSDSNRRRYAELLKDAVGPTDWRVVPAVEAHQRWTDLRTWVEWLVRRYALDHRVVPPCWYLHPSLVDVLTALRDHHAYAFDPLQPGSTATEWHRVFADLERRLRDWASRTGCTRDQHRPDVHPAGLDDDQRWAAHLEADESQRIAEQIADGLDDH